MIVPAETGKARTPEKWQLSIANCLLEIHPECLTLRASPHLTKIIGPQGISLMPMPEFHELVNEAKKEIKEISSDDLKHMQSSGEDFTLIDVREREDAEKGTIPGAVNVPRGMLEHNIDQVTTDKDRKIVLYCG